MVVDELKNEYDERDIHFAQLDFVVVKKPEELLY